MHCTQCLGWSNNSPPPPPPPPPLASWGQRASGKRKMKRKRRRNWTREGRKSKWSREDGADGWGGGNQKCAESKSKAERDGVNCEMVRLKTFMFKHWCQNIVFPPHRQHWGWLQGIKHLSAAGLCVSDCSAALICYSRLLITSPHTWINTQHSPLAKYVGAMGNSDRLRTADIHTWTHTHTTVLTNNQAGSKRGWTKLMRPSGI